MVAAEVSILHMCTCVLAHLAILTLDHHGLTLAKYLDARQANEQ